MFTDMGVIESIRKLLLEKETGEDNPIPEGYCPNCWGREEYAGKFYSALEKENVNVNTLSSKHGWVLDYAEKHFAAIRLEYEGDMMTCRKCNVKYRDL